MTLPVLFGANVDPVWQPLNGMIGTASAEPFQGSLDRWVDDMVTLAEEAGMNGFSYWPDGDHEAQIAVFAEEVVPAVRAALPG
jgi:hypothetical protein